MPWRTKKGQTTTMLMAGVAINMAVVVAIAQAVVDSVHSVPDDLWHFGTWIVALLVGVVAFFIRRVLTTMEAAVERMQADMTELKTRLSIVETTCRFHHSKAGD